VNQAIELYQKLQGSEQSKFLELVKKSVTLIFGGSKANPNDIKNIINSIKTGDSGSALQAWAKASFNYYISQKEDDGILYIDLNEKSFVYYDNADDLTKQGLRFHASTPYISSVKDPTRGAYPKIEVVPTTFGGETARKTLPKYKKKTDPTEFLQNLQTWSRAFANRRGVTDAKTITAMAKATQSLIAAKTPSSSIVANLEKTFPQLTATLPKQQTTQQTTRPRTTRPVTAPAVPRPIPGQAV
jgi:hypothetical protein